MSKFSNKLKELFSIKSVDKRLVAQALNIDRTLLYRYLNDQSFPENSAFIEQLRNELYLTPYEYKELLEAYEISKLGETVYHNRKIVAKILDQLFSQNKPIVSSQYSSFDFNNQMMMALSDTDTIYSALQKIIMDERTTEIMMNCQPDREFVYNNLFQLLKEKVSTQNATIHHILRFQSKTSNDIVSYNLQIFSELLPLLYYCTYYTNNSYYANYYYNNQAAVDERAMDIFPNILITSWCTIVMSFNYDSGIIYINEEISNTYKKSFEDIQKNTFPFVLSSDGSTDLTDRCKTAPYRDYVFKTHPSASLGLGAEFYTPKYIHMDQTNGFNAEIFQFYHNKQEILYSSNHLLRKDFFTISGLKHFLDTGILSTFFSDYTEPLSKENRIEFLKLYITNIENNPNFSTHLIKDTVPNKYNGNFGVFVFNDSSVVIENSRRKLYNISSFIEVTEKGIVDAFIDYLNLGIESEKYILNNAETIEILKEKINELELSIKADEGLKIKL